MERKFKRREELRKIVRRLKSIGYKVGLINGVFDIIHTGHIEIIRKAKSLCDILIIALNSDRSTKRIKGNKRPIFNESDRITILSAIEDIDFITLFDEKTASETLRIIKPDFHIKGIEYTNKILPEKKITKTLGIRTILLGTKKLNSTTDIIKKIKAL